MNKKDKLKKLNNEIKKIYLRRKETLLFHGWHHINFVRNKSLKFGKTLKADLFIIESTALVHDLNYIVKPNSKPEAGAQMRSQILSKAGYSEEEIDEIENIITKIDIARRKTLTSKEEMALSDADTLFKILPITPILFSNNYIIQNKIDINKIASKIIKEQKPLIKSGVYFYTKEAKQKYLKWAKTNLALWEDVNEALLDNDVKELLSLAKKLKVI